VLGPRGHLGGAEQDTAFPDEPPDDARDRQATVRRTVRRLEAVGYHVTLETAA
jgi:hypothetical protein